MQTFIIKYIIKYKSEPSSLSSNQYVHCGVFQLSTPSLTFGGSMRSAVILLGLKENFIYVCIFASYFYIKHWKYHSIVALICPWKPSVWLGVLGNVNTELLDCVAVLIMLTFFVLFFLFLMHRAAFSLCHCFDKKWQIFIVHACHFDGQWVTVSSQDSFHNQVVSMNE